MVPVSSFVLRGEPVLAALREAHSEEGIIFHHVSQVFFRSLISHCLCVICLPRAVQHTLGSIPLMPDDFYNSRLQEPHVVGPKMVLWESVFLYWG